MTPPAPPSHRGRACGEANRRFRQRNMAVALSTGPVLGGALTGAWLAEHITSLRWASRASGWPSVHTSGWRAPPWTFRQRTVFSAAADAAAAQPAGRWDARGCSACF